MAAAIARRDACSTAGRFSGPSGSPTGPEIPAGQRSPATPGLARASGPGHPDSDEEGRAPRSLRVVVADDHPLWRKGVAAALRPGFEVVAESESAPLAVAVVNELHPDLVLCDLNMPGGGLYVVEACSPVAPVVVLSVSESEADVVEAVGRGAAGYLSKTTPPAELRTALLRAAAGEPVFSPAVAAIVLARFRRAGPGRAIAVLSGREREVLGLLARGYSNPEIAAQLVISVRTVDSHLESIRGKLGLSRRAELIRYQLERGWEPTGRS